MKRYVDAVLIAVWMIAGFGRKFSAASADSNPDLRDSQTAVVDARIHLGIPHSLATFNRFPTGQAIKASDLFDAGYDLTSAPTKIFSAYDFAEAQARNFGRNSDGYCESSRPL